MIQYKLIRLLCIVFSAHKWVLKLTSLFLTARMVREIFAASAFFQFMPVHVSLDQNSFLYYRSPSAHVFSESLSRNTSAPMISASPIYGFSF